MWTVIPENQNPACGRIEKSFMETEIKILDKEIEDAIESFSETIKNNQNHMTVCVVAEGFVWLRAHIKSMWAGSDFQARNPQLKEFFEAAEKTNYLIPPVIL